MGKRYLITACISFSATTLGVFFQLSEDHLFFSCSSDGKRTIKLPKLTKPCVSFTFLYMTVHTFERYSLAVSIDESNARHCSNATTDSS